MFLFEFYVAYHIKTTDFYFKIISRFVKIWGLFSSFKSINPNLYYLFYRIFLFRSSLLKSFNSYQMKQYLWYLKKKTIYILGVFFISLYVIINRIVVDNEQKIPKGNTNKRRFKINTKKCHQYKCGKNVCLLIMIVITSTSGIRNSIFMKHK